MSSSLEQIKDICCVFEDLEHPNRTQIIVDLVKNFCDCNWLEFPEHDAELFSMTKASYLSKFYKLIEIDIHQGSSIEEEEAFDEGVSFGKILCDKT